MFRTNNRVQILGMTFLLASSLVLATTLSTIGIKAYAASDNGHSNSNATGYDKSYAGQNNANTTSDNNSTNSNERSDNGRGNSNMTSNDHGPSNSNSTNSERNNEHKSIADQKRDDYVSESAEQRHSEHVSSDAPITGPYTANMNYTLQATGNATSISNQTSQNNASLTLNMSTWKSTRSIVSMDITGGSLQVGSNTTIIYSGHAYYLINHPRLIVFGYVKDSNGVKLLKLFAVSTNDAKLPTTSSGSSLSISMMSHESKLASEWFVSMDGQVKMAS